MDDMLKTLKSARITAAQEFKKREDEWGMHQIGVVALENALARTRRLIDQLQKNLDEARGAEDALKLQQVNSTRVSAALSQSAKEAERVQLDLDRMIERLEPSIVVGLLEVG